MENYNELQYLDLLRHLRHKGKDRPDRTGVGVRGLFGFQEVYDIRQSFPLWTTKKIEIKSVISELLWFLEGSGDERRLAEIRYGKPRAELADKKTIWTANATAPYWLTKAKFEGDLGLVYGKQWRSWPTASGETVDQIKNLIDGLKNDPYSRRHIVSAWNPGELHNMALPPCHVMMQFYVSDGELSCMMIQRSGDDFLGCPFNIASYSALTYMIAQICDLKPGDFIHNIGDAHVYIDHFDAIDKQLSREPRAAPRLILDPSIKNIDDFTMESFTLVGYDPHPPIKAPMAV